MDASSVDWMIPIFSTIVRGAQKIPDSTTVNLTNSFSNMSETNITIPITPIYPHPQRLTNPLERPNIAKTLPSELHPSIFSFLTLKDALRTIFADHRLRFHLLHNETLAQSLVNTFGNIDKALVTAAFDGLDGVVSKLIRAKANVKDGRALQAAARNGQIKVMRLLLDAGAPVDAEACMDIWDGCYRSLNIATNPMFMAVRSNKVETVKLLGDARACLNPSSEVTPVDAAIGMGSRKMFRYLVSLGAKPISSKMRQKAEIRHYLSGGPPPPMRNTDIDALFMADLRPEDEGGEAHLSPTGQAAADGELSALRYLLPLRFTVTMDALQEASREGHIGTVNELFIHLYRSFTSRRQRQEFMPKLSHAIGYAVQGGHDDTALLLLKLERRYDNPFRSWTLEEAYKSAISANRIELVQRLVSIGLPPPRVIDDLKNLRPRPSKAMMNTLSSIGTAPPDPLSHAFECENLEALGSLIEIGVPESELLRATLHYLNKLLAENQTELRDRATFDKLYIAFERISRRTWSETSMSWILEEILGYLLPLDDLPAYDGTTIRDFGRFMIALKSREPRKTNVGGNRRGRPRFVFASFMLLGM